MYETMQILKQVKDITSFGIRYGNVRNLMFDGGVLDLFSSGQIHNSVQVAIPIIDFFVKNGIIKKFDQDLGDDIQTTPLASLAWNFFNFVNIRGFDWKQMFSDLPSQQAFAQIFLEYISFKIIPQWNRVEDALGNYITSRDEKSKHVLNDSINRLLILFRPPLLFGFMKKYLRFPNMELRLIDYSNATAEQRKKLDGYRKNLGIPNDKEKDTILKTWFGLWGKMSEMTDVELQKNIDLLQPLMQKAQYEAKFTGDIRYLDQLKKVWVAFGDERKKRISSQMQGQSIVKKPGQIAGDNAPLEPPKTMAEMEEERRKREAEEAAKKAEEERKAKEERERKLKEEAKRKEALAIAEAKIKAAEAIKRQE